jgi:hypothetical protein
VVVKGIDINRCGVHQLKECLNLSHADAANIWCNRPFETLDELYNKGYISSKSFSNDEQTDKVIQFIEKQVDKTIKTGDNKRLSDVSRHLVLWQKEKKLDLEVDQWNMIWRYYRLLRNDLQRKNNERREERENNI